VRRYLLEFMTRYSSCLKN